MLDELQIYKPVKAPTPFRRQMADRLAAVKARPEVKEAIASVGRINRYDIVRLGPLY